MLIGTALSDPMRDAIRTHAPMRGAKVLRLHQVLVSCVRLDKRSLCLVKLYRFPRFVAVSEKFAVTVASKVRNSAAGLPGLR
jgi:hypothetical protein